GTIAAGVHLTLAFRRRSPGGTITVPGLRAARPLCATWAGLGIPVGLPMLAFLLFTPGHGQGTLANYQRAERLFNGGTLVYGGAVSANWIGDSDRFWYRSQKADSKEFLLVDAVRLTRVPAFDHARMAAGLG